MIIYTCSCISTGKSYIGKTIRSLNERKYEHLKELRSGCKGGEWQEDFNKHGESDFVFEILETCTSYEELSYKELALIKEFNTLHPNGYNKTINNGPIYSTVALAEQSRHTVATLERIMLLALSTNPFKSVSEISLVCKVSIDVVQDLLRLKSYTWLKDISKELYSDIEKIHNSGLQRDTYLKYASLLKALILYVNSDMSDNDIANICSISTNMLRDMVRGRSYVSLKDVCPKEYRDATSLYTSRNLERTKQKSITDTLTNIKYTFNTSAEGSRLIGIDSRRVSDLVSGRMKRYKQYILA